MKKEEMVNLEIAEFKGVTTDEKYNAVVCLSNTTLSLTAVARGERKSVLCAVASLIAMLAKEEGIPLTAYHNKLGKLVPFMQKNMYEEMGKI